MKTPFLPWYRKFQTWHVLGTIIITALVAMFTKESARWGVSCVVFILCVMAPDMWKDFSKMWRTLNK